MNKKKVIIVATLVGLMGSAVAAEASGMFQKVSGLLRSDITVSVDGQNTSMKPVFINGQAYLPAKSEAAALGYDVRYNPKDKSLSLISKEDGNEGEQEQMLLLSGIIQGVKALDNGSYQLDVVGRGTNKWVILTVDKDTNLTDGSGKAVAAKDIKAGTLLTAEYGPVITMDYPGHSHAAKIILGTQTTVKEDVIQSVKHTEDGWQVAFGETKDGKTTTTLILNAGKETSVINAEGQSVTWESLQAGAKVRAYYGPVATTSVPAISPLHYLVVDAAPVAADLTAEQKSEFQGLAWSKLPEGQEANLTTKKEEAEVAVVNAKDAAVLASTDEAKALLKDLQDKGGKLVTVTYQTKNDALLGPLTVVFSLDSKTFIGYNPRR
ncbi:hypothetical protein [Paenibacillus sp. R14(2021)]|uniref:hypothetical protein n=1 Tax=Paenibacillus sp. R14(2021) TaxID=2859228 RepID=UPI001C6125B7|nr:hypothetical protein [Paenibacillus sp. R14(2021)]